MAPVIGMYMITELIYQWKIDFALILSIVALLITSVRWFLEKRTKRHNQILEAYEKVFDDAIFILLFPLKFKKEIVNKKLFTDPDPEFEKSVRNYLNSHILKKTFGNIDKFVPVNEITQIDKLEYLQRVQEAAYNFEERISEEQFNLNLPDMSPVNYFDNEDISNKFQNIVHVVGKNLSLFSTVVQRHWGNTLNENPVNVRNEYKKCLEVCPDYFTHNPRDFEDPYYDLLQQIRDDYRKMTRNKMENISWKTKLLVKKILHPFNIYKNRKANKNLLM